MSAFDQAVNEIKNIDKITKNNFSIINSWLYENNLDYDYTFDKFDNYSFNFKIDIDNEDAFGVLNYKTKYNDNEEDEDIKISLNNPKEITSLIQNKFEKNMEKFSKKYQNKFKLYFDYGEFYITFNI